MVVISLPHLRLIDVRGWLSRNGIVNTCATADRNLRACLAARDGWGYVFIDGSDPEDEQRMSLAHELAHFLRHYWRPRREACWRLGERVTEVFDGLRPPTSEECLHALIARVPIGFHWHLMQRDASGEYASEAIAAAEAEADILAYELLAPAAELWNRTGGARGNVGRSALAEILRNGFGLPAEHAARYSQILLPHVPADPFLQRLGLPR
jgi:hypothetical protein